MGALAEAGNSCPSWAPCPCVEALNLLLSGESREKSPARSNGQQGPRRIPKEEAAFQVQSEVSSEEAFEPRMGRWLFL